MSTLVHRFALLSFIGFFLGACNDSTICESDFADGEVPAGCLALDAERVSGEQKRTLFVNAGEAEFDQKCAGCHGSNGEGGESAPAFKDPSAYEFSGLVNRIETTMPNNNAEACDASCADEMARFILSGYQEVQSDDVSLFLNQGQSEYADMCVGCHGVEGEGGSSRGIDAVSFDIAGLTQFIDENMPLNNAERCQGDCAASVAAYVLSGFRELVAEGELPNDAAPPVDNGVDEPNLGNAANGQEEYGQQCGFCHGDNGEGIGTNPPLNQKVYEFDQLVEKIDSSMPAGSAGNCVGDCAADTARYIIDTFSPQEEAPGEEDGLLGQQSYEEQCVGCHGENGEGVGNNPPLNARVYEKAALTSRIDETMPRGSADSCVGDCASSVADYIIDTFSPEEQPPAENGNELLTNAGAADFADVCSSCHGANGEGVGSFPALNDPSKFNLEALTTKISDTMPPVNPSACNGDCADQIAKFILSGLQEVP